jgi:hypothetical protein
MHTHLVVVTVHANLLSLATHGEVYAAISGGRNDLTLGAGVYADVMLRVAEQIADLLEKVNSGAVRTIALVAAGKYVDHFI